MAGSINKVIIVGNVGADPEIRSTQDGREIANLSIATSESWRDKATGERREKTEWHRVVVFVEGIVNIIKNYVKKGSKIYVEGSLQTRKWVDNNGNEKYTTEIVLQGYNSSITILDSKSSDQPYEQRSQQSSSQSGSVNEHITDDLDDEIPF